MTLTEKKRCPKCKLAGQSISLFLKADPIENIAEECLSCSWRDEEGYWTIRIGEIGFNPAKQEWEDILNCPLTEEIEKEMDFKEKSQWEQFKVKTNQLFVPQDNSWTKRKYCNECQKETVHLKENEAEELEEACLPCDWKTHLEYWERERENDGIEHAKQRWEEIRDSKLNQKVLLELTPEEKAKWTELVKETNQLFVKEIPEPKHQETQSPFNEYLPYILGGVGIFAVIILIVVLVTNNCRRNSTY